MISHETVTIRVSYFHLYTRDPRIELGSFWNHRPDIFEIELTGRYRYVRTSPTEYYIEVEYFFTPELNLEWEDLGDIEIRPIARGWIDGDLIDIKRSVTYEKEVGEIQECCCHE